MMTNDDHRFITYTVQTEVADLQAVRIQETA